MDLKETRTLIQTESEYFLRERTHLFPSDDNKFEFDVPGMVEKTYDAYVVEPNISSCIAHSKAS